MTWWPFKKRRKEATPADEARVVSPPPQLPPLSAGRRSQTAPVEIFEQEPLERVETPPEGSEPPAPVLQPPRSAPHDGGPSRLSRLHKRSLSLRHGSSAKDTTPSKQRDDEDEITALPIAPRTPKSRPQSPHLPSVPEQGIAPQATLKSIVRNDVGSLRRTRTKKQKSDEKRREKQIKELSKPIDIPRKAQTWGVYRSATTKKDENPFATPASASSLPRVASAKSSVTGMTEQQFQVGSVGMFSARPTLRYSIHAQVTSLHSTASSRVGSRRGARPFSARDSEDGFTIDELDDDYDTATLRNLMDKDKRRREKKQKEQEDRARKRLERIAAKQDGRPVDDTDSKSSKPRRSKSDKRAKTPKTKDVTSTDAGPSKLPRQRKDPVAAPESIADLSEYPYSNPQLVKGSERSFGTDVLASPYAEDDVIIETAQAVRYASATKSQPSSPILVRPISAEVPADAGPEVPRRDPRRPSVSKSDKPTPQSSPEQGLKKSGGIFGSIFGRKREAKAPAPAPAPEPELESVPDSAPIIASRESESKDASSPIYDPSRTSSTRYRQTSRFREDLPEDMPSTLPTATAPIPISAKAAGKQPELIRTRHSTDAGLSRHGSTTSSAAPNSAVPISQSLASVDSEGSWLANGPRKRSSQQISPAIESHARKFSYEANDPAEEAKRRAPGDMMETALGDDRRGSQPTQPGQQEDPGADSDTYDGELFEGEITRGEVARKATLVRHPGRVHSSEGLLNQFDGEEVKDLSDSLQVSPVDPEQGRKESYVTAEGQQSRKDSYVTAEGQQSRKESQIDVPEMPQSRKESHDTRPDDDLDELDSPTHGGAQEIEPAAAIHVGITHVRSISGGSARILEIPKRNSLREVRSREAREKASEIAERDQNDVD